MAETNPRVAGSGSGSGKHTFKTLVTIHNLSGVPADMAQQAPEVTFLVALRLITQTKAQVPLLDVAATQAPDVAQPFYARDIKEKNGVPTAAFGKAVKDWSVVVPADNNRGTIDVLLDVAERRGGREGLRRSLSQVRQSISLAEVLEKKVVTLIVGTTCGQLGVSLTVSPSDKDGYLERLKTFVGEHNPGGLAFVDEVVAKAGEIASFTRLFKKYGMVDYHKRVREFFHMYGPEFVPQIEQTLEPWKDREEEFVRSLVLDNGPEPRDIEPRRRLVAFSDAHDLGLDVDALLVSHGGQVESLFADLRERHGGEPDPRSYLFPPAVYYLPGEGPPTSSSAASSVVGGARPTQPPNSFTPSESAPSKAPTPAPSRPGPTPAASDAGPSPAQQQQQSPAGHSVTSQNQPPHRSVSQHSMNQQPSSQYAPAPTQQHQHAAGSGGSAAAPSGAAAGMSVIERARRRGEMQAAAAAHRPPPVARPGELAAGRGNLPQDSTELWSSFLDDLRRCHVPPSETHYLPPEGFAALCEELGYPPSTRHQLVAEWQRQLQERLQVSYHSPGEQPFESAKTEVVSLCQLDPININVAGVVSLRNGEHEAGYSVRLAAAQHRASERYMIVGDYGRLMEAAKYGVTQALVNKAFRGAGGGGGSSSNGAPTMVPLDVPGLDTTDGIVFHRRPFQGLDRPFSVAALVCDVVVGKSFTADHRGLTAINVDRDFHANHDSVVLDHGTSQQSVVVFSPQQVLPRFLVHCHVDPTVSPCPTHPHKAVEYFLVESGNFACSQCVVLGPHRGARVITVEEACAEARQRIAETASEADAVGRDFAAAEELAARNLDDLRSGKARQAALDAADDIRREADRRAQQLVADFDAEAKRRLSTAEESRDRIARSRRDFSRVADQLNAAARSANPSQVLRALNDSAATVDIEAWRTHGQEARALAAAANAQPPLRAATNRANNGAAGQRAGSPFGAAAAGASTEPDLSSFRPPSSHPPTHRPQASAAALLASLGQAQGRVVQQHHISDQSNHSYNQQPQQPQQQQPRTSATAPWMTSAPAEPTVIRPTVGEGSLARSASARDGGELYQKFMNLKGHRFLDGAAGAGAGAGADRSSMVGPSSYHQDATTLPGSTTGGTPGLNRTPGAGQQRGMGGASHRGAGPSASTMSSTAEQERKLAKEQMSQGWAAFRKGDTEQARRLWSEIYERNEHNATGARARAYMAEALTRDNEDAARWYERALRYDPGDVMTLFNYGVMLEGSDKKKEALSLFDTASRLGDTTAARRAETLRRQLGGGQ